VTAAAATDGKPNEEKSPNRKAGDFSFPVKRKERLSQRKKEVYSFFLWVLSGF
jgi:hypothetical protein